MHYLSLITTVITFSFTAAVLIRWRQRGGLHLLFWGLGLALYGLGTLTEVWLGFQFNEYALKTWYLCGAMLTAAWLGQGTLNLLVRKKMVAQSLNLTLLLVSVLALVLVFTLPIDQQAASLYDPAIPASAHNPALPNLHEGRSSGQYQVIMQTGGLILVMTILLNIYGTLTLVGGALYSSFLFWRKRVLANRMMGNILIAVGGLFPALGGTFVRGGMVDWLYISEFFGVIFMFAGFLKATSSKVEKN